MGHLRIPAAGAILRGPMELTELFQPSDFVLGFEPTDKWDAIARLIDRTVAAGRIRPDQAEPIREAVVQRERSMSTGMERGIAIPHAAVEGIDRVQATIGIVAREDGLAFESIDAQPARLVVLLLIPRAQKLLHIRTLAEIARVLGQESVREALQAATTGAEAWEALRQGEGAHPA
jgi:mannitol/fructose-specific phosphotransferase system IIA component (Ntr-type)